MKSALLCILVTILIPSTAQADWQYTRWGMSWEQVIAASKGNAKTKLARIFENDVYLVEAPYSAGEYQFQAEFGFEHGSQLSVVILTLQRGRASSLLDELKAKYGRPAEHISFGPFNNEWVWRAGADKILFTESTDNNLVIYTPLHTKASKGL